MHGAADLHSVQLVVVHRAASCKEEAVLVGGPVPPVSRNVLRRRRCIVCVLYSPRIQSRKCCLVRGTPAVCAHSRFVHLFYHHFFHYVHYDMSVPFPRGFRLLCCVQGKAYFLFSFFSHTAVVTRSSHPLPSVPFSRPLASHLSGKCYVGFVPSSPFAIFYSVPLSYLICLLQRNGLVNVPCHHGFRS